MIPTLIVRLVTLAPGSPLLQQLMNTELDSTQHDRMGALPDRANVAGHTTSLDSA